VTRVGRLRHDRLSARPTCGGWVEHDGVKPARDPRMDAYIDEAEPFAGPVLKHLRKRVHAAVPGVTETIKWNMPFFEYGGSILCFMAAFKAHCGFGFWHRGMKAVAGRAGKAMGNFGRITKVADLPPDATMRRFLKTAAALNDEKAKGKARPKAAIRRGARRAVPSG